MRYKDFDILERKGTYLVASFTPRGGPTGDCLVGDETAYHYFDSLEDAEQAIDKWVNAKEQWYYPPGQVIG